MTRKGQRIKQIEQFASKRYEDCEKYSAFICGAIWADNNPDTSSLWHDADEEPQADNVEILYISKSGCTDICIRYKGVFNYVADWDGFVKQDNVAKWAYMTDLLPKGGEQ